MNYPQYKSWATNKIYDTDASLYDWQNMPLSEMAERALTICAIADEDRSQDIAFYELWNMAKALKEQYPRRSET